MSVDKVRGLAWRWVAWTTYAWPRPPDGLSGDELDRWLDLEGIAERPLNPEETDTLRGWIVAEVDRHIKQRRQSVRDAEAGCPAHDPADVRDGEREDAAYHIMKILGGEFDADLNRECGLTRDLIEWATEGRWPA